MGSRVGEKKLKRSGGKNFSWGGNKKLSLASFALCGCLAGLARVCFLCAVADSLSAGVRILFAGANFLFAGGRFLFVAISFLSPVSSILFTCWGFVNAGVKCQFGGGNF